MITLLAACCVPLLFYVASFAIGCFEKLPVRMFKAWSEVVGSAYIERYTAAAIRNGFIPRLRGVHTKYHSVEATLLLSFDRAVLATIGAGKIIGLTTKQTILMSATETSQVLITTDDAGTAEIDPQTTRQIILNATFDQLLAKHAAMIRALGVAVSFSADADWSTVDEINQQRLDRAAAAGRIRYTDDSRSMYCKTISWAFRASFLHGIGQILYPPNWWRNYNRRP